MLAKLALLFIVVPLVEIALLVKVGQLIDFWPTIAIVVVTGIVGAWLARLQGRRALAAIRVSLSRGELPGDALLDGLLVLVAGVVLVTPGILTDITGIALLIPPVRAVVRKALRRRIQSRIDSGGGWVRVVGPPGGGRPHWEDPFARDPYDNGDVIDAEVVDVPSAATPDTPSTLQ